MLPIQMWIWFATVDGARLIDCSVFAKLSHSFPEWSPELSMDQQVNAQQRKGLYNFISTLDTASFLKLSHDHRLNACKVQNVDALPVVNIFSNQQGVVQFIIFGKIWCKRAQLQE